MRPLGKRGNVSFAAIAVLLFLGAVLVQAQLGSYMLEGERARQEAEEFRAMQEFASRCNVDVRSHAGFAAVSSLAISRQTGTDPSIIFQREMERYLNESFPRTDNGVTVIVGNNTWGMEEDRGRMRDLVPIVGNHSMYVPGKGDAPAIRTDINSAIGEVGVPFSNRAWGNVVFNTSSKDAQTTIARKMDIPVESTYPFLADRMNLLAANTQSEVTGTGRLVQYILTTLAQYRVLHGDANPADHRDASDLLSEHDVEVAVNIAVYLEEMRAFRAIDPASLRAFEQRNLPLVNDSVNDLLEIGFIDSIEERSLTSLLQDYLREGSIDAADLVALFLCLDKEPIAIDEVIAQSLYTVLDQMVLKFMDYFSLSSITDNRNMKRMSDKLAGYLGVNGHIWVDSGRFETGETVMSSASNTEVYVQDLYSIEDTNTSELNVSGEFSATSVQTSMPPFWQVPIGDSNFYANGNNWTNLSLSFALMTENSTFQVVLLQRDPGMPHWYEIYSQEGGGEGIVNATISEEFPILQDGVEFKFLFNTTPMNITLNLSGEGDGGNGALENMSLDEGNVTLENASLIADGGTLENASLIERNTSFVVNYSSMLSIDLAVVESFPGVWLNKTELVMNVRDFSASPAGGLADAIKNTDGLYDAISDSFKDIIYEFFTKIIEAVSADICYLLFGDSRPQLYIDPNDSTSIVESTRTTTRSWVRSGLVKMRQSLYDEDFLVETCQRIIDEILSSIVDMIKGVLEDILGAVGGFIESVANSLVRGLCNMVRTLGGVAADAVEFITFGLVQSDSIRDKMDDIVDGAEDFWDDLREEIRSKLNTLISYVEEIIDKITDMASEIMGEVLGRLIYAMKGLIYHFLNAIEHTINGLVDYMLKGSAVGAVEFREILVKDDNDIYNGTFTFVGEANDTRTQQVSITQEPAYISPDDENILFYLSEPRGMHYTDPTSISEHPYETTWDVMVMGEIWVNASTPQRMGVGGGLYEHSSLLILNISVPVTVFSGWALNGVDYDASNTFIGDLKTLFQMAWEKLVSIFEGVISFVKKIADLFSRLLQEILSKAMYLVDTIEQAFDKAMNLFGQLVTSAGFNIASDLLSIFMGEGDTLGPINVFGFTLLVTLHETPDDAWLNVSIRRDGGAFEAWGNLSEGDASLYVQMAFWDLDARGKINSFVDREFEGVVEWNNNGHGWIFDFHGPEDYTYHQAKLALSDLLGRGITVPTPAGPATIDVGVILDVDRNAINASVEEELGVLGSILMEGPTGMKDRLNPKENIEGTVELAQGVVEFVLVGDPFEKIDGLTHGVSNALTLEFFLDVTLGVGDNGVGCTLSVVITDPIFTLAEAVPWLIEQVAGLMEDAMNNAESNTGGTISASPSCDLSTGAMENISLRLELNMGGDDLGRELSFGIEANLPLFGELVDKDLGNWRISLDATYTKEKNAGFLFTEYEKNTSFAGEIQEMVWLG